MNWIQKDLTIYNCHCLIKKIEISEKSNFLGFGWTHNLDGKGAWSEGTFSNLLFKVKKLRT